MKFEIDEKKYELNEVSGLLYDDSKVRCSTAYEDVCRWYVGEMSYKDNLELKNNIEKILNGLKKTQTKLINREIQAIQDSKNKLGADHAGIGDCFEMEWDSKNEKFVERTGLGYIKSVTIDGTKHTADEIEQNQKIVNNMRKYHNLNDSPQNKVLSDCLNHIVKEAVHKDIKDL